MQDPRFHEPAPLHSLLVSHGDPYAQHGPDAWTLHYRQLKARVRDLMSRQQRWHGLPTLLDELDRLRRLLRTAGVDTPRQRSAAGSAAE